VILSDSKVQAVLFNIFGGITRCDEVARGLIEAFSQLKRQCRSWCGSTAQRQGGRQILADANLPHVHAEATMDGAAAKIVELAKAHA